MVDPQPTPFTCATCGGDMQMIVTKQTKAAIEGVTHCPKCDKDDRKS